MAYNVPNENKESYLLDKMTARQFHKTALISDKIISPFHELHSCSDANVLEMKTSKIGLGESGTETVF